MRFTRSLLFRRVRFRPWLEGDPLRAHRRVVPHGSDGVLVFSLKSPSTLAHHTIPHKSTRTPHTMATAAAMRTAFSASAGIQKGHVRTTKRVQCVRNLQVKASSSPRTTDAGKVRGRTIPTDEKSAFLRWHEGQALFTDEKEDRWTCGSDGTLGMDGKMPRLGGRNTG